MACIDNFVRLIHLHEHEFTSCYAAAGSFWSGGSNKVKSAHLMTKRGVSKLIIKALMTFFHI